MAIEIPMNIRQAALVLNFNDIHIYIYKYIYIYMYLYVSLVIKIFSFPFYSAKSRIKSMQNIKKEKTEEKSSLVK